MNLKKTVYIQKYKQQTITKCQTAENQQQIIQMHQITLQQLSKSIPRKVKNWSINDVIKWFSLNEIEIDEAKIKAKKINGAVLMELSPINWMEDFALSKFIARRVVQWLQEDREDFDQLIEAQGQLMMQQQENSLYSQFEMSKSKKWIQNQLSISEITSKRDQPNLSEIIEKCKQKQTEMIEIKNQIQLPASQQLQIQCAQSIEKSQQILGKRRQISDSLDDSMYQDSDEVKSLNNQKTQRVQQRQLIMQRVYSEQTERVPNHHKNLKSIENRKIGSNRQNKIQREVFLSKWDKRNKLETQKFFNEPKLREKQVKQKLFLQQIPDQAQSSNIFFPSKQVQKRHNDFQEICQKKNKYFCSKEPRPKDMHNYVSPPREPILTPPLVNPYVKFITSQFIPYKPQALSPRIQAKQKYLKIRSEGYEKKICSYSRIGRFRQNEIVFMDETVSRQHANITISGNESYKKYMLEDIGSRFGTFVECRGSQQNIQGKSFLFGDTQIQIMSIQINKSASGSNSTKKASFDIKIKIDNQKQFGFMNRTIVTIGRKVTNDVRIENCGITGRIWMQKEKKVFLQSTQGKLFVKLKKNQIFDIENNMEADKKMEVVFGSYKASIQLIQLCLICCKKDDECNCHRNGKEQNRN